MKRSAFTRALALMLAVLMIAGILAGCSGQSLRDLMDSGRKDKPEPTQATTEAVTEPTEETEVPTEPEEFHWYDDSDIVRGNLSLDEMPYEVFDPTRAYEILDGWSLDNVAAGKVTHDSLAADYQELVTEFNLFSTVYSIATVRYYADVTVDTYGDDIAEMDLIDAELNDVLLATLRDLLDTEFEQDVIDLVNNDAYIEEIRAYEDMPDEELEITEADTQLTQQYNEDNLAGVSVKYNGTTYTEEDLDYITSYDEYMAVSALLAEKKNSILAPILLDLIELRNREAELYGYDTYAESCYEGYNRDYTPEDARVLHEYVKEYISPLWLESIDLLHTYNLNGLFYMDNLTPDDVINAVDFHVGQIDPELSIAFDYLKEYHLYDIDYGMNKGDIGFTTTFPLYNEPVIFNNPDAWFYDIETMIHEFGHFNYFFHQHSDSLFDPMTLDTAEIHSQGMEVLFLPFASNIYGKKNAEALQVLIVANLLNSIVDGCLYDEFQQEIYAAAQDHKVTVEEMNATMRRLGESYGYTYDTDDDQAYDWVNVGHTYESPFYYISYATSAVNALDILSMTMDDRQAAINTYMTLTTVDKDTPYQEALAIAGLHNTFDPDTLPIIAAGVEAYLDSITAAD